MAKDIAAAVREICLSFPEATEAVSHGSPDYRVRGKTFASHVVNHHGDGRISLWLSAPPGAQQHYTESDPEYFFVPPYVGPRGWLGVHLNHGLDWKRVAQSRARGVSQRRAEKTHRRSRPGDRHQAADQDDRSGEVRSDGVEAREAGARTAAQVVSRFAGNVRGN